MSGDISSLQEQSQAQRELWMMEDILAGLKINRGHFRFLLGLQRHHSKHQSSFTVTLSMYDNNGTLLYISLKLIVTVGILSLFILVWFMSSI